MNDREAMRGETRNLRREVHESQQFADKLQKEKRDLSNEIDRLEARLRQFQSESQDYEREINELSHRYELLNELKDKITQGKDYFSFILCRTYDIYRSGRFTFTSQR